MDVNYVWMTKPGKEPIRVPLSQITEFRSENWELTGAPASEVILRDGKEPLQLMLNGENTCMCSLRQIPDMKKDGWILPGEPQETPMKKEPTDGKDKSRRTSDQAGSDKSLGKLDKQSKGD